MVAAVLAITFSSRVWVQELPAVAGPPAPLPGTAVSMVAAPPAEIAWTVPIPAAPIASPVITDDRVIVAYLPGIVAAYDRSTKDELWHATLNPDGPLVTDGTLLFVPAGGAIHALRTADGSLAWQTPSGKTTAPLVVKEGWLIAATEGTLTALRAADGSTVWTKESGTQHEAAAIAGDVLFVPLTGGRLVARKLRDGEIKWDKQLGGSVGEPFVLADAVYVGASDKKFYCVNAETGEIRWPIRVGSAIRGRAASDGERVFFAALNNLIRAVDRSNGHTRWEKPVPFRPGAGPFVAGGSVFVAGAVEELRVFQASTGNDAGTLKLPSRLTLPPGFSMSDKGAVFAAITGNLEESWNLLLISPTAATAPPSR